MEIDFLVRVSARMAIFLPRQNISSFVTDCYISNNEALESDSIDI